MKEELLKLLQQFEKELNEENRCRALWDTAPVSFSLSEFVWWLEHGY